MSDEPNFSRTARVIRGEEASYAPWEPPPMGQAQPVVGVPTVREIEALHRQAREEGYAQGRAEALAAVREPLERLLRALAEPLADLDEAAERELLALVMAVARQLVRRELKTDPGEIVACVREALAALPAAARQVRVHLHPEDAKLVREALRLEERAGEHGFRLVEDPTLTRGGCRVSSETSQIDATLETRLNAVAARLFGGERQHDESDPRPVEPR
jgi:flagellar assembly protein FliH